jgi:hypothetical protein
VSLQILTYSDERLRRVCRADFTVPLSLIPAMFRLMPVSKGVGCSAQWLEQARDRGCRTKPAIPATHAVSRSWCRSTFRLASHTPADVRYSDHTDESENSGEVLN